MEYDCIGKSIPRIDAFDKITGKAKYVGDLKIPGMLYGKILRSPIKHGIIKEIDVSVAKSLKGVRAVITYKDVPQYHFAPIGHPPDEVTPKDTLILDRVLRYVGDPVAAVAADTVEIAEEALKLIKVEYEELPAYLTAEEALAQDAIEIHKDSKNICGQNEYEIGDVDKALAEADYIIEDYFKTPIISHSPIENHVSLAYLETNGRLVVHASHQATSLLRRILSEAFGIPIGKIRVIKTFVGGGFGGKQSAVQEPLNAALAFATGKPVLLELTREEATAATRTRHSMSIRIKSGFTKEGQILAREMEVISNTGAYACHGHSVVYNITSQFAPLYPTPNLRFKGTTVYTNITIGSAMRGYGIPQLAFTMESHIDNIAKKLGVDPLEFRQKNTCKVGDQDLVTNIKINSCGLPEIFAEGKKRFNWDEKRKNMQSGTKKVKGVGVACFSYAQSCFPHEVELSGARVMLNEDCTANLFLGCAEIGQGSDTVMLQILAETLGIPVEWIHVIAVDTDVCPYDNGAYASRQTYVTGMAVKKAALACKKDILEIAEKITKQDRESLDTREGWVINRITGRKVIQMKDVTMKAFYNIEEPRTITHEGYYGPIVNALSFGATFAEVEVDLGTGKLEVLNLLSIMDSGKIINPLTAEGQVFGGNVMSFGYGVMEQLLVDPKTGKVLNDNLLDYKIPTMLDAPNIECSFVETYEPSSVFGAKSLGEPPNLAPAPAIRNAVLHATGIAMNEIPLTPERVFMNLQKSHSVLTRGC